MLEVVGAAEDVVADFDEVEVVVFSVVLLGGEMVLCWEVELGGGAALLWETPDKSPPWSRMSRELAPM